MNLEGESCWSETEYGPVNCICGNDCEPPPGHSAHVEAKERSMLNRADRRAMAKVARRRETKS